jgi:glutamate carboxypeptidase
MFDQSLYQPHLDFITSQRHHMTQLVYDWSNINSGSFNIEGLTRMQRVLEDNFLWLEATTEVLPLAPYTSVNAQGNRIERPLGNAVRIRKRPEAPLQVFLGGHMDTVFGTDHPFQRAHFINEDTLNGPGVADLKGGLVVMLKALEALERSPWARQIGWEVLINPDEEIGSQSSDIYLKEAAARNHLGLIYEPSLPDGSLVSRRKGSGNFSVVVRGKSAHAGRDFASGRNAIALLSEITLQLHQLNGSQPELTLNIGSITGGGAVNVVPDTAVMHFNVRIAENTQQRWMLDTLDNIIRPFNKREGYHVELHGNFTRPTKHISPKTQQLQQLITSCAQHLSLPEVTWKPSGGCCDGNNLAAYGLANIDTMGVRGGNIHSSDEFLIVPSLVERAQWSALILMKLASGEFTWNDS